MPSPYHPRRALHRFLSRLNRARPLVAALVAAAGLVAAGRAAAADLVWQAIEGRDPAGLEKQVERWARVGYAGQVVVCDAPKPLVLLSRVGWRNQPANTVHRLVGRSNAATVEALGRDGFLLKDAASSHGGDGMALFRRPVSGPDAGRPDSRDYRSLDGIAAEGLEAAIQAAAREGFRVAAGFGGTNGPDWLILERPAGETASREARLVVGDSADAVAAALNRLAREGFVAEAVWSRFLGKLAFFGGPKQLVAAASRRQGETRPVAHVTAEWGKTPTPSGEFVGVAALRAGVVVVTRAGSNDYSTREVLLRDTEAAREREKQPGSAWVAPPLAEWVNLFDSRFWSPLDRAWAAWDSGHPDRLVGLEFDSDRKRANASASPGAADRPAAAAAVAKAKPPALPQPPAGATALGAGGGEPGAAWLALLETTRKNDLKATKAGWTGAKLAAWAAHVKLFKAPFGMGFSEKSLFETEAERAPTDPVVLGGWMQGPTALVRVEATASGRRSIADHTMQNEAGRWKLAEEGSWRPIED